MILLDIGEAEKIEKPATKEEILQFFKKVSKMPAIEKEKVYQDILNNDLKLPKFKFDVNSKNTDFYFGGYKDNIIIKDLKRDYYYYIQGESVFESEKYESGQLFYKEIAKKMNKNIDYIDEYLSEKLEVYEAVFFSKYSKYISSLDEFIKNDYNNFMLREGIEGQKERDSKVITKNKMK